MGKLSNRNIAVLAANGFEESELTSPVERLKEEGATVHYFFGTRKNTGNET